MQDTVTQEMMDYPKEPFICLFFPGVGDTTPVQVPQYKIGKALEIATTPALFGLNGGCYFCSFDGLNPLKVLNF